MAYFSDNILNKVLNYCFKKFVQLIDGTMDQSLVNEKSKRFMLTIQLNQGLIAEEN